MPVEGPETVPSSLSKNEVRPGFKSQTVRQSHNLRLQKGLEIVEHPSRLDGYDFGTPRASKTFYDYFYIFQIPITKTMGPELLIAVRTIVGRVFSIAGECR